jgi:transcriptional regulator with GAF, ATPase, and Fis domain
VGQPVEGLLQQMHRVREGDLQARGEVARLRGAERRRYAVENLIGDSKRMRELRELIAKIAESDATTVLIEGENGTGKELAARAIHFGSARADQPLMAINCSVLPANLLESEQFGHERDALRPP